MPILTRRDFVGACPRMAAALLAAALPAAAASGCGRAAGAGELSTTAFFFDTVCTLRGTMPQDVLDGAVRLCARFERLFSRTRGTSDVARINAAGGAWTEVDPQTAELVALSLAYCEESGGLFDITIGAVSALWDFTEGVVPADADIREALSHVGWRGVEVEGDRVRLRDPDARLDLGGIAKGYIADRLADYLAEEGVTSASVNLGGNVKVLGDKPDGSPWSVGVRDPADPDGQALVAKVEVSGESVVTSGLYERAFSKDGRRYWHVLDPRTGYPVQTDTVSATVRSAASVDGDGYTKPLLMMDAEDALAFARAHGGLQVLLVGSDGAVSASDGSGFVLL